MNDFSNGMKILLLSGLMMLNISLANGAVWHWPAEVTSVVSDETNAHTRAFLWIPENYRISVRGDAPLTNLTVLAWH
jgi:hypothetical protein